jgi:hypothetical protein
MSIPDEELPELGHLEWNWIQFSSEFGDNLPDELYLMLRAAFAIGARSTFDAISCAMQSPDRAAQLGALHDELNALINEITPTQGSC